MSTNPPDRQQNIGPVAPGRTVRLAADTFSGATTSHYYFNSEADAVLISLYVESVGANLDVSLYTLTDIGRELLLATFPTVTAPTANLLLKKGANIMSKVKVTVITTGAATFELYARGVSGAEASVRVLGATSARATQVTIGPGPTLLVPAALTDRSGMVVKNNNGLGGVEFYLGFTAAESAVGNGYPINAQESLGMDIASGVEVWANPASGTADTRLLESGS